MNLEGSCFSISDGTVSQQNQQQAQQQEYCSNGTDKLRAFVNGKELDSPSSLGDYVLNDNDRILLIYGNQTADQLTQALDDLQKTPIIKT